MPNQSYLAAWEKQVAEDRDSLEYKLEGIILDVTDEIIGRMRELGIKRSDLAERIHVNKAMISKVLNGNENLTLKTLLKFAMGLDCELSVKLPPCGFETRYFYVAKTNPQFKKQEQLSEQRRFFDEYHSATGKISKLENEEGQVA